MGVMNSERVMRRLYEISTEHDRGLDHQVQAMLTVGCESLGLSVGILARIRGERFELTHLCAPAGSPLSRDEDLPLSDTLAVAPLEAGGPVGMADLEASPFRDHAARRRWGLGSYLGVPVIVEGKVHGTLSFSDPEKRSEAFTSAELDLIRLMALWLGVEIQRQQSRRRLQRAEESFRLGVEASPAAMIMVDRGGRITYANTMAQELFGYGFNALLGSSIEMLVPASARVDHPGHRDRFSNTGGSRAMGQGRRLAGLHADGREIPVEVGLNTIETPYGSFTVCTIMDMTERQEFEREIRAKTRRLEESNRTLSAQAFTDDLTGLFNRRALFSHLETVLRLARRQGSVVSLLLLDVDHFKLYNDTAGHQGGDEALRRVAGVLREASRRSDIAARYGGEEFVLVLPETDAVGAAELAERVRTRVAGLAGLARPLTISIGVTTMDDPGADIAVARLAEQMISRADQALYRAKHAGRNRVVGFTDS